MIHKQIIALALTVALLQSQAHGEIANWAGTAAPPRAEPRISSDASAPADSNDFPGLRVLIAEALENSPEVQAARREREAARQRISPAEALDDLSAPAARQFARAGTANGG